MERGKLPEIPAPAWPQTATARLTNHPLKSRIQIAYAIDRYTNEAKRLYNVVDKRLSQSAYLAGDDYTIADIATFPWLRFPESKGQTMEDFPHLKRWFDAIAGRPAVVRGVAVLAELRRPGPIKQAEREVLFGATQHARH